MAYLHKIFLSLRYINLMIIEFVQHLMEMNSVPPEGNVVILGSAESAYYHEAGHVAAALSCGASVHEAFVNGTIDSAPWGQTKITATLQQKIIVSLGGAAAELWLFQNHRYRLPNGTEPVLEDLIARIDEHVGKDVPDYVEAYSNLHNDLTPLDAKIRFIGAAHDLIGEIDWDLVERLVSAMRRKPYLLQADLNEIIAVS